MSHRLPRGFNELTLEEDLSPCGLATFLLCLPFCGIEHIWADEHVGEGCGGAEVGTTCLMKVDARGHRLT